MGLLCLLRTELLTVNLCGAPRFHNFVFASAIFNLRYLYSKH